MSFEIDVSALEQAKKYAVISACSVYSIRVCMCIHRIDVHSVCGQDSTFPEVHAVCWHDGELMHIVC